MSSWNKTRLVSAWRKRAAETGIDREVALLIDRFLPGLGVRLRALTHVGLIDLMADAARTAARSAKEA